VDFLLAVSHIENFIEANTCIHNYSRNLVDKSKEIILLFNILPNAAAKAAMQ